MVNCGIISGPSIGILMVLGILYGINFGDCLGKILIFEKIFRYYVKTMCLLLMYRYFFGYIEFAVLIMTPWNQSNSVDKEVLVKRYLKVQVIPINDWLNNASRLYLYAHCLKCSQYQIQQINIRNTFLCRRFRSKIPCINITFIATWP